jgi:hypothetical protein
MIAYGLSNMIHDYILSSEPTSAVVTTPSGVPVFSEPRLPQNYFLIDIRYSPMTDRNCTDLTQAIVDGLHERGFITGTVVCMGEDE